MYGRLGEVYLKRGDLAAAVEYRRKSLALRETNLKADPVNAQARRDMSVTLEGIGDVLDRMNDLRGARLLSTRPCDRRGTSRGQPDGGAGADRRRRAARHGRLGRRA